MPLWDALDAKQGKGARLNVDHLLISAYDYMR